MGDSVTRSLRERLEQLDACAVSDALDALGLPGAVTGLRELSVPGVTVCGRVRTVQAATRTQAGPHAHIGASLVDTAEQGDVIVIANEGRTDVSCWGGLLAQAAVLRGVIGVVVDGACRDIQESTALGLPVFARDAVPVSARGRVVQRSADEPILIAGVDVAFGDWVVGDPNGVVFIRRDDAERVISLAEKIVAREHRMLEAVVAGKPVVDVMHDSSFPTAED